VCKNCKQGFHFHNFNKVFPSAKLPLLVLCKPSLLFLPLYAGASARVPTRLLSSAKASAVSQWNNSPNHQPAFTIA
jgi:hypothetical protein